LSNAKLNPLAAANQVSSWPHCPSSEQLSLDCTRRNCASGSSLELDQLEHLACRTHWITGILFRYQNAL
jgi:hypothetical protein